MGISEWLFYYGIAGMAAAALLGTAMALAMARRKKKLRRKLDEEYGKYDW